MVRDDARQKVARKIAPQRFPLSINVPWNAVMIASTRGAKNPISRIVAKSVAV